jgi:hypothetical protein
MSSRFLPTKEVFVKIQKCSMLSKTPMLKLVINKLFQQILKKIPVIKFPKYSNRKSLFAAINVKLLTLSKMQKAQKLTDS